VNSRETYRQPPEVSPLCFAALRTLAPLLVLALAWAHPLSAQLSPMQRTRAEQLLRERLPCLGCHSLNGKGGAIGPDLSAVGTRRSEAAIRRMLLDPQKEVAGTVMPRVPMTTETLNRIAGYLAQSKDAGPPRAQLPRTAATTDATGARLYAQRCATCHGARGQGDGPNARYLNRKPALHADARIMATRTDDRLFDGIFAGGVALGVSPEMPAFGQTLSRDQIWSLVRHIRELCKCRQPAWADKR
jgi:mono/diheme cytochrome c family protein